MSEATQPQTLAERIAAAQAAAKAARKAPAAKAKNSDPKPAPKAQPLAIAKPSQDTVKPKTSAKKRKSPVSSAGNLRSAARLTATIQPIYLTDAQRDHLADVLRNISVRPGALNELMPDVLDALEAVIAGAKVPGPAGHGDRMTLLKLTGLPLHAGAQTGGGKGEAIQAMRNLTSALERAHLRGAGRVSVTVDAELVEEPPQNGHSWGYPHKIGDLVRIADAPAEPPAPAQISTADEVERPSSPAADPEPWSLPDFLRGP